MGVNVFFIWENMYQTKKRNCNRDCYSSVSFDLLLNGNITSSFEPKKGLRQGDSLSLYLFILCSEVLSRLLEKDSKIQGIKISKTALEITHLMYADIC